MALPRHESAGIVIGHGCGSGNTALALQRAAGTRMRARARARAGGRARMQRQMSRFDHDRVMTILADALDLPASRRAAFLDSTCLGEPGLRREIDELLEGERPAGECFDFASEQMARDDPGRIGPYTVVEPLGEGGMAIVYKAEQQRPVKRTVAIKLIKLGMDTRHFVARFDAERQALAMMDHPNVARVFDAGATDTGRPYFVMEYVPG